MHATRHSLLGGEPPETDLAVVLAVESGIRIYAVGARHGSMPSHAVPPPRKHSYGPMPEKAEVSLEKAQSKFKIGASCSAVLPAGLFSHLSLF